jgi:hypothetical protein
VLDPALDRKLGIYIGQLAVVDVPGVDEDERPHPVRSTAREPNRDRAAPRVAHCHEAVEVERAGHVQRELHERREAVPLRWQGRRGAESRPVDRGDVVAGRGEPRRDLGEHGPRRDGAQGVPEQQRRPAGLSPLPDGNPRSAGVEESRLRHYDVVELSST